ncbi:leucine-rich repeat protein, partial [Prevotellamassilia timonensis]|uniref:leucine-rich repeat protein n=1 Tax=Prevotellamassilia timonensis TaxID=1852370 RepID=UPI003FEE21B1
MKHFCHKICLVVLACFSYLSASAYDFEADGLYFTITSLKDLTVSVDGAVNKDTDKIVIPQTVVYKGRTLTVTSVGDNAFSGSSYYSASPLQSVTLPNTILSIGEYAFSDNINLTEVVLPEQLLEIG